MHAVLFDIDGTLLDTDGAGKEAFSRSLKRILGLEDSLDYITWAGATDLGVLQQIMDRHNAPWPEAHLGDFFHCLGEEMDLSLQQSGAARLFQGVKDCVEAFHAHPTVHLGLLTGNGKASALQKVRHGGVLEFFNPDLGGYGDEHADRPELARRVKDRLPQHQLEGAGMVVIGDTPNDIRAAHAVSAKAVGVATGHFSAEELAEAGADVVFSDLQDTCKVLAELDLG